MSAGYIGITDANWYRFNKGQNHSEVLFWRRASKPVRLSNSMPFFLLVKGKPRYIRGYGFVKLISSDSVENLWEKYGNKMGEDSLFAIESALGKERSDRIGFYLLRDVKYIDSGIDLDDLNIKFAPSIVSGKKIDTEETERLLNSFGDASKFKELKIMESPQSKYTPLKQQNKPSLSEINLENIFIDKLKELGLILIKRQLVASPVGRIDLLCEDKEGHLIVIELKKYGVKSYSIIDQIARYMGYIKKHIAKEGQKVKGIIITGSKDEKLEYAASAIPNLEVKTFKLHIE
jgi:hypothetical protein